MPNRFTQHTPLIEKPRHPIFGNSFISKLVSVNFVRKTLLLILFVASIVMSANESSPRVVLVLSGGGSRGLSQIGILKALEQANIQPDIVVGSSMGTIIASLYATGYSPDSIEHFATTFDWAKIFANSSPRKQLLVSQKDESENFLYELRFRNPLKPVIPQAISEGQTFFTILAPMLAASQWQNGTHFDSLPIPLRIVATDIISGKEVVFCKGNLPLAIRASCGIPLVYTPIDCDTMLLLDGGLSSNIPVDVAQKEFPGSYIIAVDATSSMADKKDLDNPVRLVDQIVNIGLTRQKVYEKKLAQVLITPNLQNHKNTDFSNIDSIIEKGYLATMPYIDKIKNDIDSLHKLQNSVDTILYNPPFRCTGMADSLNVTIANALGNAPVSIRQLKKKVYTVLQQHKLSFVKITSCTIVNSQTILTLAPAIVKGFSIQGNSITKPVTIQASLCMKKGDTLQTLLIAKALSSLYATDLFKTVNITVDTGGIISIFLTEKDYWRARFGVRIDEFHGLEGYVQPAYENILGLGTTASLLLQYGLSREKYALELSGDHVFSLMFANSAKAQTYISRERIVKRELYADSTDTTITRVRLDEQTLGKYGFLGLIGTQLGKTAMLDGGLRLEQFKSYQSKAFKDPFGEFKNGIQYFIAQLTIDDLDKFPFPEKGQKHYISVGVAHNVIHSSESFFKLDGSLSQYYTIGKIHTFSPHIQFVWANDSLPDVERVFLGGANLDEKNREIGVYNYIPFFGMKPRTLPGDVALLFRGEYRCQVYRKMYCIGSLDWGYAWPWNKDWLFTEHTGLAIKSKWQEFVNNAPVGIGVGIAYESPVGPIRFSWGRLLRNTLPKELAIATENYFYISAGHDF